MKKILFIFVVGAVSLLLTSCSHSEYLDFASFVNNYNQNETLEFENFISYPDEQEGKTIYSCPLKNGNNTVLLTLVADNASRIEQCRITLAKCTENGEKNAPDENSKELFKKSCINTVSAFTYETPEISEKMLADFDFSKIDKADSFEQTKGEGSYYCILLTNELATEFIIKNKWLCEIEETQKPENKNDFAENTNIRTETVPLR